MTRTCTQLGICQHRCDSAEACDWHYIHAPSRGPSLAPQYPSYKKRNIDHHFKWFVRVVFVLLIMSFTSGVVRGCIASRKHNKTIASAKVTT